MMREVNYLTDKSQDSEKLLSFKEQILRDLEEANEQLLKIEKSMIYLIEVLKPLLH